jgi:hypothetical protein
MALTAVATVHIGKKTQYTLLPTAWRELANPFLEHPDQWSRPRLRKTCMHVPGRLGLSLFPQETFRFVPKGEWKRRVVCRLSSSPYIEILAPFSVCLIKASRISREALRSRINKRAGNCTWGFCLTEQSHASFSGFSAAPSFQTGAQQGRACAALRSVSSSAEHSGYWTITE